MKYVPIALPFAALLLGCAHSKPAQPFILTSATDVVIESARFGSSSHAVDVTVRLVHVLDDHPDGIFPTPLYLAVSPVRDQTQSLRINYWYHGKPCTLIATANTRVSYNSLMEYAERSASPGQSQ